MQHHIHKIAIWLLIAGLSACAQPPAEEAIRKNIDAVQTAVEEKDTGDIMAHLKDDFIGNGHWRKEELRRFLVVQFLQHNRVSSVITHLEIDYRPELPLSATMTGTVIVTGADNLLPKDGRLLAISGKWRLVEDDWLLESLDWE